jgi:catechol 1,2-dioxygenase
VTLIEPSQVPFLHSFLARRQRKLVARGDFVLAPTPADRLGPAYRRNAPWRSRMRGGGVRGAPFDLSGRVLSAVDGEPLEGARLEVWQTDGRGLYSNLSGLWPRRMERRMWLRATLRADALGRYSIETVLPAHYPLGPWSRPRHLHFAIGHPRCQPLVTQLYFQGDPLLRRDPLATAPLILSPAETEKVEDGIRVRAASFDFVLLPPGALDRQR